MMNELISTITLPLLIIISIFVVFARSVVRATLLFSLFSMCSGLLYISLNAFDVALTEIAVGACISTLFLLFTIKIVKSNNKNVSDSMNISDHVFTILCTLIFFGTFFNISMLLPIYGNKTNETHKYIQDFIDYINNDIHIPNMVSAILADIRAYDTLIETTVIFTAAISIYALLYKNTNKEIDVKNR